MIPFVYRSGADPSSLAPNPAMGHARPANRPSASSYCVTVAVAPVPDWVIVDMLPLVICVTLAVLPEPD